MDNQKNSNLAPVVIIVVVVLLAVWLGWQYVVPRQIQGGELPYKAWFHGDIYLPDGKTEISFRAESNEGRLDSVTIADASYDFEDGRLFFVSLVNGGFDVTQLDQDTRTLTPQLDDPKEIEAFLRNVPEFEKFISRLKEQP